MVSSVLMRIVHAMYAYYVSVVALEYGVMLVYFESGRMFASLEYLVYSVIYLVCCRATILSVNCVSHYVGLLMHTRNISKSALHQRHCPGNP